MNNAQEKTPTVVQDKAAVDDGFLPRKVRGSNGDAGIELHELLRRPTRKGSVAVTCVDYNADRYLVQQIEDLHECLSANAATYLRDVHDHMLVVFEIVESYHDFVSTLTESYMSAVSNRMNKIMKTLTMISTIFVPLTFLAGVYGMNMPIPEYQYWFSYPIFWIFSLVLSVIMLRWFKRRGWL